MLQHRTQEYVPGTPELSEQELAEISGGADNSSDAISKLDSISKAADDAAKAEKEKEILNRINERNKKNANKDILDLVRPTPNSSDN